MPKVDCPRCRKPVELPDDARPHERGICDTCYATYEVAAIDPIRLASVEDDSAQNR